MKSQNNDAIVDDLLTNEVNTLIKIHSLLHTENNVLINPSSDTQHVLLLYKDKNDLEKAIVTYINEGLKRDQLCLHSSVNLVSDNQIKKFALLINDYQENKQEGNLLMLNLEPHYKQATVGNLKPFDTLVKNTINKGTQDYNDGLHKQIRLTLDCAGLLIKNGYFEEGVILENWWHQKPIVGSYLCCYPEDLFDKFPNNVYFSTLFNSHDAVIDSKGRKVTDYMNLKRG